jgi:beta-galactosidase/beta-glucuronidase
VEDPRFLYWADRMGLLVAAEMANAYLFDEDAVARITHEWIEVVERDYNHPSIIIWTPVNESWGVPNLSDPRQLAHLKALYYLTKSLDETRLASGVTSKPASWGHFKTGQLSASRTAIVLPYR